MSSRAISATHLILLFTVIAGSRIFTAAETRVATPLRGVKAVQVEPAVIAEPDKVKESFAPNLVTDSLKNALKTAGFEVAENAPIKAYVVLDEFSSGNTATRVLIGMGAGRSSVTTHLVLKDADGKELCNTKIHVNGKLAWSSYEGNTTQRHQAVESLEQRFVEQIEKMK